MEYADEDFGLQIYACLVKGPVTLPPWRLGVSHMPVEVVKKLWENAENHIVSPHVAGYFLTGLVWPESTEAYKAVKLTQLIKTGAGG